MKKEIVLDLKKGKSSALKIVFDQFYEPLVRYAYSYLGDKEAAKDVVQQCLINLWKHKESLDYRTFESYLFVAVRNGSFNYLRDIKKWETFNPSVHETFHEGIPESNEQQKIITSFLESGIEQLPKKCKHIFLLNKVEGLTYAETAQELGISVKTVERHMGIALKKLRAYMCQAGDVKIN